MSVESDGSETSKHSYTRQIEELIPVYNYHDCLITEADADEAEWGNQVVRTDSEADKEEDTENVCKKDKNEDLSQLHLAAERSDTEAVRSLLMTSANVDVLDSEHNTPLHYATLNDVVNLLLSRNVSFKSRNAFGQNLLHLASEIGHLAIAQILLDSKADSHITDRSYSTPTDIAAMHGHYELVQLLMKYREVPLMYSDNSTLHLAAKFGQTNVANLCLNHNQNVDAANFYGDTPLHLASQNGHFDVAEVLLRSNANADIGNASGKTPLHIAAEMGYAEIIKAIIDHEGEVNAVDRNGNTALHFAARNGHSIVVNVLLNQCTETDAQIGSQLVVDQVPADEYELSQHPVKNKVDVGHTSLLNAAEGGNVEMADNVLCHSSTVNAGFIEAQATPLRLAAENGCAEMVKNLIFNGANVNTCNKARMTPLHLACRNGHTSIVKILLDNHAIVDVTKQSQETPFYLAAKNGHADILDLLLHRGLCDFVLRIGNETPLHVAVKEGNTDVVEVILKHSRRISGKVRKDANKLQENAKKVQLLKSYGRSVSAEVLWVEICEPLEIWRNSDENTALDLAVISTQPKMVQLLLNADHCVYSEDHLRRSFFCLTETKFNSKEIARVRIYDEKCEMYCANIKEIAQALIYSGKFNVNQPNVYGKTPLSEAMMIYKDLLLIGLPEKIHRNCLIQLLLENGADFNMSNRHGETPLISASYKGYNRVIQLFFNYEKKSGMKLDLDARNEYGATALILAAESNDVSTVRLLLKHKAPVKCFDYCGFTALHAAFYEPNKTWLDIHFFCKGLHKRKFDNMDSLEISSREKITWRKETMDSYTLIGRQKKYLRLNERTTRFKEEVVKLLLANDETDVNAVDVRGNTPLDLAVKSFKLNLINSTTLKALRNRGAIRNSKEPEDEAPIEVGKDDERGRNPLHRLIISRIADNVIEDEKIIETEEDRERLDFMVYGILLRPEKFKESATAADKKGRTPLHYAVMPPSYLDDVNHDLVRVLLKLGSNINAADIYGKIPLHYAEMNDQYDLLVQYGADENTKDRHGHTPKELRQLRESVTNNENNANGLIMVDKLLYAPKVLFNNYERVTELSKRKVFERLRIYSQSPRPQESSEETVWKIWTKHELNRLNRRLSLLKPSVQHFIKRLANGIKKKDWRFECKPILVGSADEETKVVISADFDFNFKLIKFSQICDPFPHPLGVKGYFQLRRKTNEDTTSRSDEMFDCFFNLDHCLLTKKVNSRFKIILEEILSDSSFWQDEHYFDWNVRGECETRRKSLLDLTSLTKTVRLRMIHPVEDGEGGFVFVNIGIDIVTCVHLEGWWSDIPLPIGMSPAAKAKGSTFVFDGPRFNPSTPHAPYCLFSETFARISFALLESRLIKESSPLIKAAYIVCKLILYCKPGTTYQLKTCLLYCMEALYARNGSEIRKEEKLTPKQLAFWVERIMFCYVEFSQHDVYPCYFMPSFRQEVSELFDGNLQLQRRKNDKFAVLAEDLTPFCYSKAYDFYLDICPDDTTIDIPIVQTEHRYPKSSFEPPNVDPMWEQFDREELIRTLSSRNSH